MDIIYYVPLYIDNDGNGMEIMCHSKAAQLLGFVVCRRAAAGNNIFIVAGDFLHFQFPGIAPTAKSCSVGGNDESST